MGVMIVSDISLPLTPVLSLRERENRLPRHLKTCRWICDTVTSKTTGSRDLFPLPEGEGQGEGERDVLPRKRSACEPA